MLVFNEETLLSIVSNETMNELMDTIADAMTSDTTTPLRTTVSRGGNSFMLMPSLADDYWGLKILTLYPDNPKLGRAFINGVVLLVRAEDGVPIALFNGSILTALRTGAVGGLGVRTLASRDVSKVGLIGAGVQGYWQLRFACAARNFKEIWIYDIDSARLPLYVERLSAVLDIPIRIASAIPELVSNCEVVLSATNSQKPLFAGDEKLFSQKCFVGIGSYRPDMREFPDEIFAAADVYVDTLHALDETGDLIAPIKNGFIKREKIRPLSEAFLSEPRRGTFVYKSVGGAEFDLFSARKFFEMAIQNNLGLEVKL